MSAGVPPPEEQSRRVSAPRWGWTPGTECPGSAPSDGPASVRTGPVRTGAPGGGPRARDGRPRTRSGPQTRGRGARRGRGPRCYNRPAREPRARAGGAGGRVRGLAAQRSARVRGRARPWAARGPSPTRARRHPRAGPAERRCSPRRGAPRPPAPRGAGPQPPLPPPGTCAPAAGRAAGSWVPAAQPGARARPPRGLRSDRSREPTEARHRVRRRRGAGGWAGAGKDKGCPRAPAAVGARLDSGAPTPGEASSRTRQVWAGGRVCAPRGGRFSGDAPSLLRDLGCRAQGAPFVRLARPPRGKASGSTRLPRLRPGRRPPTR